MSTDSITPDISAEVPATSTPEPSAAPASLAWETAREAFRRGHGELRSKYEPCEKLGATPEETFKEALKCPM
jgi:hypothetical protein